MVKEGVLNDWSPIGRVAAEELEIQFSEDEIKKTVFNSDGSKASGPDGFTMAFYQSCWDTVNEDLVKVFSEFF